jgi:hypothetical protein
VTFALRLGAAASLVVLLGAATPPPAARFVPGTYRQIDTVTKKPLGVGNQIVIIAGKGGRLGFSVNAIRQADENQGFVAGVLPVGPLPATWQKASSSGNCRLLFEAAGHGLKVTQDLVFGDCGFGEGVSASGTYALVPEKPLKT